jgi:hypothetical protein
MFGYLVMSFFALKRRDKLALRWNRYEASAMFDIAICFLIAKPYSPSRCERIKDRMKQVIKERQ